MFCMYYKYMSSSGTDEVNMYNMVSDEDLQTINGSGCIFIENVCRLRCLSYVMTPKLILLLHRSA